MTELKKKVTLKRKQAIPEPTPIGPTQPKKKNKWWLWVLIAVIIVLIIILLLKNKKNDVDPIVDETITEVVVSNANGFDAQQPEGDTNTVLEEGNIPISPAQENTVSQHNNESQSDDVITSGNNHSKSPNIANLPTLSNDLEENAKRVIRGDFGNGQVRKNALGDAYFEIQAKVNEMYREHLVH